MREVERLVLLRAIDTHWVEHLTQMEELREGIYLRGYGQQDPLIAYKKESHRYWEEMNARLAAMAAQMILRVSVQRADDTQRQHERERHLRAQHGTASSAGLDGPKQSPPSKKPGRNDPCYCGSGRKYKKCHGRGGS